MNEIKLLKVLGNSVMFFGVEVESTAQDWTVFV